RILKSVSLPGFLCTLIVPFQLAQRVVVFNPKGTYEYQQTTFSHAKRVKHLKQGTVVHVKRLVRRGVMTRYQLTNGTYLTGNKQWVSVK
ncbi:DUF5776 domain-containing protein, partial [Levilactobacillus tongjiangensis]